MYDGSDTLFFRAYHNPTDFRIRELAREEFRKMMLESKEQ
jgi:hypothetical protein